MAEAFSNWLLIQTGREGELRPTARTSQMFDSIHGSLEGAPRIPISERLRARGATPAIAMIGADFDRHDAAHFAISTTNNVPAAFRKAARNSGANSPSSTIPSSAARAASTAIFDASPGAYTRPSTAKLRLCADSA